MQNTVRIHAPVPNPTWRRILAVELTALYWARRPEFGPVHEAIFRREARQMWGKLIAAMRPMLAPNATVTVHIQKSTAQKMGAALGFDPSKETWAVAIKAEYDPADGPMQSLLQEWGSRFYGALRLAMPATDNDVDDIIDGDPENLVVLQKLQRIDHPEITDAWLANNPET